MDGDRVHRIQQTIDRQLDRRQSNKVLHNHPSPVFWLERPASVDDIMAARRRAAADIPKRLNVYVGTPYCLPTDPDRCGFCLFPSEIYRGRDQLEQYLDYLRREVALWREWADGETVANVYFGGGTANLYRPEQYAVVLGLVRDLFGGLDPGVEITLEGLPQLFTAEKLDAARAAGFNRISMGVQQLDDELIRLSGRKQSAAHVFRVLDWCRERGLPCSVDLIFGWPRQTVAHMLADLERIAGAGVPHITHYELNVAGRTHFSRHRRAELPSPRQNLEMYRIARDFLLARGYRQVTAYDWEKVDTAVDPSYRYEAEGRQGFGLDERGRLVGHDAWGLGYAGISFFLGTPPQPGWALMNAVRVDEYFRLLDTGRLPVERGFHYAPVDLRLTVLFQMLHGMQADRRVYAMLFGLDLVEEHAELWQALGERGWIEITTHALRLVGDGVFYTPLVQGLLAQDRMEELRRSRSLAPAELEAAS